MSDTRQNNWEVAIDSQTGRPYFFHRETGETRWDPPHPTPYLSSDFRAEAPAAAPRDENPADNQSPGRVKDSELMRYSAGQIADMCFIQQQRLGAGGVQYKPLDTGLLQSEPRPSIEKRRLEIRLHKLQEEIQKIL